MTRLWTLPVIADVPAELIVWIVIGIVWAIAQVFAKRNKASRDAESSEQPRNVKRSPQRPSVNTDPVSPNDELRNFLRKIAGETERDADHDASEPWQRRQATGQSGSAHTAPHPAATQRAAPEPRRHPSRPTPPPLRSTPTPPTPPARKPSRQAPNYSQRRLATQARIMDAKRTGLKRPAPSKQRTPPISVKTGRAKWQTAVLHREILGPPRALRPYSPNDF